MLSFIVGSIVGLSQVRIKRLLTFSTINHVGFLLLALAVSTEESVEGFVFYLVQYSLTNVNTFLTILAFGYITKGILQNNSSVREFVLLDDLTKGELATKRNKKQNVGCYNVLIRSWVKKKRKLMV